MLVVQMIVYFRKEKWCDGFIIQAVADKHNLRIVIAEWSNEHFAEFNIMKAVTPLQRPTNIYLEIEI